MKFAVISGTGWVCPLVITSEEQAAKLAASCIKVEEYCDTLDAANDRSVAIARERGLA